VTAAGALAIAGSLFGWVAVKSGSASRSIGGLSLTAGRVAMAAGIVMVVAGLVVGGVFDRLGLVPDERNAKVVEASVTWNYTTVLNIVFLCLASALVWRFLRTGGLPMLRMMNAPAGEQPHRHAHA